MALNDLSFSIEEDEVVGLIGPNGFGKSTAFNVITGMFPVGLAEILFREEDITRLPAYEISGRGIARISISKAFPTPHPITERNGWKDVWTRAHR